MRKPITKRTSVNHPLKSILKMLFREVLEQIPPEVAEKLTRQYEAGGEIGFRLQMNSRGHGYKTAFQPFAMAAAATDSEPTEPRTHCTFVTTRGVCGHPLVDGRCKFLNHNQESKT